MKLVVKLRTYLVIILLFAACNLEYNTVDSYPNYNSTNERKISKKNTTYYVDPNYGNDENVGTEKSNPWKTFNNINQLILNEGNRIEILSGGKFYESLFIIGNGSEQNPININFAPGRYDFYPQNAYKQKFNISNTNDAPDSLKSIAIYLLDSKYINITANNSEVIFRGKMIEVCISNCENVNIEGFSFDYNRPTVSEFTVEKIYDNFADVKIHNDSEYKILDSKLIWVGEGWTHFSNPLWQVFNPISKEIYRYNIPIEKLRFEDKEKNKVRIHFDQNPGFNEGLIYQNRDTFRDYAAVFVNESKNIKWKNINVYFMHGMGFVNQFSENLIYDSINVAPRKNSGRTCSAWADIFHFSSCKGEIKISNSYLSAANDDAINVHGTHLRIVEILSDYKIKVKFMHPQTFGFNNFQIGDSIEFISSSSLLPYEKNIVTKSKMINEKEIELIFNTKISEKIKIGDVVENVTWTPDFKITNSTITQIPTRGILVTTRGKVIIENNEFLKTNMSSILISDDANSWYESGYVRDVTIINNKFLESGEPVISIEPEKKEIIEKRPVHKNIRVLNNKFQLKNCIAFSGKSAGNVSILYNTFYKKDNFKIEDLIKLENCYKFTIERNSLINNKFD